MTEMLEALAKIGREAARMVLLSPCVACGDELPWSDRQGSVCGPCWRGLEPSKHPLCRGCGAIWATDAPEADYLCIRCVADPLPLDWIRPFSAFEGTLEQVIRAFKFNRHDFLAAPLGTLLAHEFSRREDHAFDVVVPVPMHRRKRAARGYNQSELLGRSFSRVTGLPLDGGLLRKTMERRQQSTLPREERAANVRNAFNASPDAKGKAVLLIDDICTTGETLAACATALKRQKAARVAAVVLARA